MRETEIRHPYFLGIGGIGMSALALHFLQKSCKVSGYDRLRTPLTGKLESLGAGIHYVEDPQQIPQDVDAVIYTPAVPKNHKEWDEIRRRNLPVYKRAEMLGRICGRYRTFAVAGTHGKTTTSAMLAFLLRETLGCNAILGGIAVDFSGNYWHDDRSRLMVTEADEYDRSFLQLHPYCCAVTSWDADHLDIYGDVENMRRSYREFIGQSEHCIANVSLPERPQAGLYYGVDFFESGNGSPDGETEGRWPENTAYAADIRVVKGAYVFTYRAPGVEIRDLRLACPGRHNVENAVAALSMALAAGAPVGALEEALPRFSGVHRRLEKVLETPEFVYYDDYAHHPVEISASIGALREFYPDYAICVLFQPHLYSRTRDLAEGFAQSLSKADRLCLVDIYPARELPIEGVDTRLIGERIHRIPVSYASKGQLQDWIGRTFREIRGASAAEIPGGRKSGTRRSETGEAVSDRAAKRKCVWVTMGAGDIDAEVAPVSAFLRKGGCGNE